jgi:two-component system, NtrC family, nitrogen regulation sensor histidine kinase GlnL
MDTMKEPGKHVATPLIIEQEERLASGWNRLQETQRLVDMGKMAATLAHGVRSPLNAIKGGVVYIKDKLREKELVQFINIIEDEISRLDSFIAKFLSSFMSDGAPLRIDMNSILERIEKLISPQAKCQKIRTSFEYGRIFPVMVNPFQLEQAILNVINNAIEAMPSGGTLEVKTGTVDLSGRDFSFIRISDTGKGIAEEKKWDGSSETGIPVQRGKGLGLLITREIIRSCGGNFEIKSRKSGTQVTFFLPKGACDE